MNSKENTPSQTKKLSVLRDHVQVKEIPIFNVKISCLSMSRTLDLRKIEVSDKEISDLPDSIRTNLARDLVPKDAVTPLESKRRRVSEYMKRYMVQQKPFGFVVGHGSACVHEDWLMDQQQRFYELIMDEETYIKDCKKIIDAFRNDQHLQSKPWFKDLIEHSIRQQPSYEEFVNAAQFELSAHYIGEGGTADTYKLKTAKDTFAEICVGTKGKLIKEISDRANEFLKQHYKVDMGGNLAQAHWQKLPELCDKLADLSFVSKNIFEAEKQLREMLNKILPAQGGICGAARTNLAAVASFLSDPFMLADKIDNGKPLFKEYEPVIKSSQADLISSNSSSDSSNQGSEKINELPVILVEEIDESEIDSEDVSTEDVFAQSIPDTDLEQSSADSFIEEAAKAMSGEATESSDDWLREIGLIS